MARSTYVYVVLGFLNGHVAYKPVAAFTVKHELVTWLQRLNDPSVWDSLSVFRVPDGGRDVAPTQLSVAGLLEAGQ